MQTNAENILTGVYGKRALITIIYLSGVFSNAALSNLILLDSGIKK